MYTDERIRAAFETMVGGIQAPPIPMSGIQRRINQPRESSSHPSRYARLALAVAAICALLFAALPSHSMTFIRELEARYQAALQAQGGFAPPPAPDWLRGALMAQASASDVTLATAQSRAPFTIVPPAGLPRDVVSERIRTAPTGIYSGVTRSWRMGPPTVRFIYRRADGHAFELLAEQFDPSGAPFSQYIFEAKDPTPGGQPVLVRHERFYWRDGNQMIMAIEGEGITAREIEAIRIAMRGIALPRRWPYVPNPGASLKLYPKTEL